ncbi:hypothetical protein D3C77_779510 [compost metagenome]
MILFVDGRPFHLQEETVRVVLQQLDGFLGHRRQRWHIGAALWIILTGYRRLIEITVVGRFRSLPAYWHIAWRKQAQ